MKIIELEDIKDCYREDPEVRRLVEMHNILTPFKNDCTGCIEHDHDNCNQCDKFHKVRTLENVFADMRTKYAKDAKLLDRYALLDQDLEYFLGKEKGRSKPKRFNKSEATQRAEEVWEKLNKELIDELYSEIEAAIGLGQYNIIHRGLGSNRDSVNLYFTRKGFSVYNCDGQGVDIRWT